MGDAYNQMGQVDKALAAYQRYLAMKPNEGSAEKVKEKIAAIQQQPVGR